MAQRKQHHTKITTERLGFRASCSCGWVSPHPRRTENEAENDASDHVVAIAGAEG